MTGPTYWLVLPAAGRGARFGGPTPKQYLVLGGRTVLEHALAPFLADPRLAGVVVALEPGDERFGALALANDVRVHTTVGGDERARSVAAGLRRVAALAGAGADPWVLVHDAARPLVTTLEINRLLEALEHSKDGALLACPVVDSLKRADADGCVATSLPREDLWRAQTPQAFRLARLADALDAAERAGRVPSDEAQAVEQSGAKPRLVPGSVANLKITAPGDLALAEFLLAERRDVLTRHGGKPLDRA